MTPLRRCPILDTKSTAVQSRFEHTSGHFFRIVGLLGAVSPSHLGQRLLLGLDSVSAPRRRYLLHGVILTIALGGAGVHAIAGWGG